MTDLTGARLTRRRVVHAEWIKLRSVRSALITAGCAALAFVALSAAISLGAADDIGQPPGAEDGPPGFIPTDGVAAALSGHSFAQLVLVVLGVLVFSGEYATGMIRVTLAAVPARLPVLWAKALVVGAVSLLLMLLAGLLAFLVSAAVLSGEGVELSLSDPGALRAVLAAAVYLAAMAVSAVACGALLRHATAAITVLFSVLFLLPNVLGLLLPSSVADAVEPYLPSKAGEAFISVVDKPELLPPAGGLAAFSAFTLLLLAAAAYRLKHGDG
jgi:ABC-type transport system involved in multi-copper enzyme maturation permease subunit